MTAAGDRNELQHLDAHLPLFDQPLAVELLEELKVQVFGEAIEPARLEAFE